MRGMTMFFWDQHKTLTNYYEVLTRDVCEKYELTQMEYDILMFLNNNPQHNTAAEIVKIRKSTKSHVSTSLKKLESKGLIQREQSIRNKKYIKITLLDKAEQIASLSAQIDAETARAEEIEEYRKYTQTKAYVEEVAKDKLGLVYEGEILFQEDN